MTTFEIEVQDDHLQRISQVRKPILAIAELIWNAVDADADQIGVTLVTDPVGGLTSIEVSDNGHGIPHDEARALFCKLGGSWKQEKRRSKEKRRILHGKEGRGRFRAFALGRVVEWSVCYGPDNDRRKYTILMIKDHLKRVEVSDEKPAPKSPRGVTVRVTELEKNFVSLTSPLAADELAQTFALYLRQYPNVHIRYQAIIIDPKAAQERTDAYSLPAISTPDGERFESSLEIVEWRMPTERRLFFCDHEGFPLDETNPGIQAAGFDFTAYLKSDYFAKLMAENRLEIANLDAPTSKALDAAMLSKNIQLAGSQEREHLVIELKRPSVVIGADEITQIKNYAFSIASDERFHAIPVQWVFWVISNDINEFAKRDIRQEGRPHGVLHKDERVIIWIKTWSQVINECRARLQFFAEKLNYTPDRDSSLAHLQRTYNKYLGDLFNDGHGV